MRTISSKIVSMMCAVVMAMMFVVLPESALAYSTGDDYPSKYKSAAKDALVDEWNFYNRECTSFVAWCLNSRNGVHFTNQYKGVTWGHAKNWVNAAKRVGISVDSNPAVGSVGCSTSGNYGHVVWVKSVSGNNVVIEEYNYGSNGAYHTRTVAKSAFQWIHIQDITHTHDYNIPSVSKAPTATSTGTWTLKCSCGASSTVTIPAIKDANIREGVYRLQAHDNSNMYVSVKPYQCRLNGEICLYRKDVADQKFTIKRNSDGTYTMYYSEFCVDLTGAAFAGQLQLYTPNGTDAQKWYVVNIGDGYYRFVNKATYYNMDVANNNMSEGTRIMTWYNNGNNAQKFKLELVECLNHSWNSGTVTKQPGVGTTGTRQYTCTACGKTKTETIPALVSMNSVSVSVSSPTYTGSALTPSVTVTYNSKTLVNGTDYIVSYSNNVNAGTASVTLTGKGSYSGTKTVNFTINKRNASDFTVDSISSKTYTGSAIKPSVTVKYGGKALVSGTDYSVVYSNNVEAGTATIKITGKGNFTGTKSVTFKIIKFTWKKIDGKWYYMDNNGKKATGFKTIDGSTYYFDSTGAMKTGWNQISSKWYYMNKSGVVQTGWQKISKKWYYFNDSGVMITGVKAIDGKYYYFNDSGVMQTGWQEISGKWYYFDKSGVRQTGWQQISKKWYYFNTSGVMQTGLKTIEGSKYFFNDNGSMLTGWKEISSKWYWFKSDGSMAVSETIKISGKSYTFNSKGVCTNP